MSKKSKAVKKAVKRKRDETAWKNHLILKDIEPLTLNQCKVFEEYEKGKNLVLHGSSGTGKSFLGIYLAIQDILTYNSYNNLVIVRSATPTHSQGFLPGNIKEKSEVYEEPYKNIFSNLFNRDDAYSIFKQKNTVQFITTSYLRGITLDKCIILVDEFQSMTDHEINSIITRLGNNSKLILCGDIKQNDLFSERNKFSCAKNILTIMKNMTSDVSVIEFDIEDIVRSGFIKKYLLTRDYLENKGIITAI